MPSLSAMIAYMCCIQLLLLSSSFLTVTLLTVNTTFVAATSTVAVAVTAMLAINGT